MAGFPIRKSQDQCSLDSFPGLIAAYRVLHRLITPRHPPCTLSSLTALVPDPKVQNKSASPPWRSQDSVNLASFLHYPYVLVKEPASRPKGPSDPGAILTTDGLATKREALFYI